MMGARKFHKLDLKKAAEVQIRLSSRLILKWDNREVTSIAGGDCGYDAKNNIIRAAVVVMTFPHLKIVEVSRVNSELFFPYIPGFLNFREGPALLKAFRRLRKRPEVFFIDGNGIAHPRKMGLASYVGVLLDVSTIGCAKTPFFSSESPGPSRGDFASIYDDKKRKVGVSLRTRSGVKPIFLSPGNRIDFKTSRELALMCSRYRVPEPLRMAHFWAAEESSGFEESRKRSQASDKSDKSS